MRATQLFMPTLKEDPSDAEAVSHRLAVRGGFIRQFAAGIYIFLPLGWRVMNRIDRIIREEMDAIGAQELSMPTLHPADVWQETGRYYDIGPEMFRLRDRGDREMVLAMTHEEVFTWLAARELRSYRDVPQIWYQIQLKFRDEARPKGGILRVREFLMKDSYSFDVDEAGLEVSYEKHIHAYDRIFARCGLAFYRVESDPGMMGGAQAHEYMAPSAAGEDKVALCDGCGYAANVELARSVAPTPAGEGVAATVEEVATPDQRTIKEVVGVPGCTGVVAGEVAAVHGRTRRRCWPWCAATTNCTRASWPARSRSPVRPAHPDEVREALGVDVGFVGPVGVARARGGRREPGSRRPRRVLGGTSRERTSPHTHLRGVVFGRDVTPEYADLREAEAGDGCPECGVAAAHRAGHRGRQHLQAGHQVLGSPGSDRARRERRRASADHGFVRHRTGPHHGGGRGAAARRPGCHLAEGHRSFRRLAGAGADEGRGPEPGGRAAVPGLSAPRAGRSCGTTATSGPGSSSPTPNCWDAPCA